MPPGEALAQSGVLEFHDEYVEDTLPIGEHYTGDALTIDYPPAALAYLDPPYSPHEYSTYYHIWDSIVRWDKPEVDMATNRRVDRCSHREEYATDSRLSIRSANSESKRSK